jgi:N12 class adenine-specific DNA methylase
MTATMAKKKAKEADRHREHKMVRLPLAYHNLVKELARKNKRAVTGEVLLSLDDYLRKNGIEPPPGG